MADGSHARKINLGIASRRRASFLEFFFVKLRSLLYVHKGLCNNYQEGGPKTRGGALHKIAAKIGGSKVKSVI